MAVVADGPGAGSSVVLIQQWAHHPSFDALTSDEQERVIGRTKADSVELNGQLMPVDSHVSRPVIEQDGEELAIYRRNTAYGGPSEHGTLFVGFCATQLTLELMLERMAGVGDGIRDALTRHTTPLTGAYYVGSVAACPAPIRARRRLNKLDHRRLLGASSACAAAEVIGGVDFPRWRPRRRAGIDGPGSVVSTDSNTQRAEEIRDPGWPTEPDPLLIELAASLPPGRGLDIGSVPGRNSLWLAAEGWDMTLLDA